MWPDGPSAFRRRALFVSRLCRYLLSFGFGAGLAVGAIVGGLLATPYYYGAPYYYAPRYYYEPDDAVDYCLRRFRSYDPRSGTYLGYDGYRHPCP